MQAISEEQFQHLFAKYLEDKCTPEEVELIIHWVRSGQADHWMDKPLEAAFGDPALSDAGAPGEKQLVLSQLLVQIAADRTNGAEAVAPGDRPQPGRLFSARPRRLFSPWMMAAASLILLLALGYWYFTQGTRQMTKAPAPAPAPLVATTFHARPGTTGAILTLADGSQVNLDSAGAALPETQGDARLSRNNNELVYAGDSKAAKPAKPAEAAEATVYNTLVTPRGREYSIVLSDGTKVWLNAGSSIRYPVKFDKRQRDVTITGEAYLEVAQDKDRPFTVASGGTNVTVLGTKFDVTNYEDDQNASVTLLQGSVRVGNGGKDILLTPGHQVQIAHAGGTMTTRNEDGSRVIAWTRGLLDLDNADFASLMRQISRWYDIDVVFKGMPKGVHIGGLLHRNVDLDVVLQYLGDNGIHYTTQGKTITILP
ncbi:MAG TPA: FecR domain-containing protein [Puia sp.]|nr:FecR domain-containing protein [Puia sp.]